MIDALTPIITDVNGYLDGQPRVRRHRLRVGPLGVLLLGDASGAATGRAGCS